MDGWTDGWMERGWGRRTICMIMKHSYLNDMEIPGTTRFIPKGFELGTLLSYPIRPIETVLK